MILGIKIAIAEILFDSLFSRSLPTLFHHFQYEPKDFDCHYNQSRLHELNHHMVQT